jgi:peptide/nickel transport system permease protein/oligopeptide transport system permease protein
MPRIIREYFSAFRNSNKLRLGTLIVGALIFMAIFAPLLAPYNPYKLDVTNRMAEVSQDHLLGTDHLGRDTLSRLIYGTRTSIFISVIGTSFAFALGLSLGTLAGYARGLIEHLILLYLDAIRSFPAIILILVVVSVLGPSVTTIIVIFGFTYSSLIGRTARAITLSVCEEGYVETAVTVGSSTKFIVFRHIVPNVVGPTLMVAGMYIPLMIMAEAGLSFLGLGVPAPMPSWGSMLRYGFENIRVAVLLIICPSVALAVAMLGFNLFAEGIRDILNPEKRGELIIR